MRTVAELFVWLSVLAAVGLAGYAAWDRWRRSRHPALIAVGLIVWALLVALAEAYLKRA